MGNGKYSPISVVRIVFQPEEEKEANLTSLFLILKMRHKYISKLNIPNPISVVGHQEENQQNRLIIMGHILREDIEN